MFIHTAWKLHDKHLISLTLKRRLTDKIAYDKQHIQSAFVNNTLQKLREINLFYSDVVVDNLKTIDVMDKVILYYGIF